MRLKSSGTIKLVCLLHVHQIEDLIVLLLFWLFAFAGRLNCSSDVLILFVNFLHTFDFIVLGHTYLCDYRGVYVNIEANTCVNYVTRIVLFIDFFSTLTVLVAQDSKVLLHSWIIIFILSSNIKTFIWWSYLLQRHIKLVLFWWLVAVFQGRRGCWVNTWACCHHKPIFVISVCTVLMPSWRGLWTMSTSIGGILLAFRTSLACYSSKVYVLSSIFAWNRLKLLVKRFNVVSLSLLK